MRSGNLNFSVPLLKAQGRHGASLGLGLSYNSQNWRQQNGGYAQKLGYDSGYGFGWKLQAGSIIQIDSTPGVISHYIFTDSTGAEYRLDVNDGGYWWGKEGVYVAYDAGSSRLRFMDGTFWEMSSISATTEPDSGTRYPTKVQDSNGNFISLEYKPGSGQGGINSSSRISTIKDIRSSPGNAYTFTYDGSQHLTSIAANIPTGENYSFTYTASAALAAPFGACQPPGGCGSAQMLQSFKATGPSLTHSFEYGTNGAGELTTVTLPYKGELRWTHGDSIQYSNGQKLREVKTRQLVKQSGAAATTYTLQYDTSSANPFHFWSKVKDPNGVSEKTWLFGFTQADTTTFYAGLVLYQQETVQGSGALLRNTHFFWSQDASPHLNRYIGVTETTIDPGMSYEKLLRNEQVLDIYGNVTSSKTFNFNNTSTPLIQQTFTYQTGGAYAQRFIFNRQTGSTTTHVPTGATTVTAATYDNYPGNSVTPRSGLDLHDTANYGQYMTVRGNRTGGGIANGYYSTTSYDVTGFATGGANGNTNTAATPDAKNVAATTITPNYDSTKAMTAGFNSVYQITSVGGPNGASTSIGYDANARPANTTGPNGSTTFFVYDDVNRWKKATTNNRWVKTYFDGFGRTIKEETGYGASTVVATVDTEYDSCGCSPLGKMKRVSRPYSGGTPIWTTYNYDSQGRVLSVVLPNNMGATTYAYEGNTTKVTQPGGSPAVGKWKKHEVDAVGNLVKVTEPDPASPATQTFVTTYTHNDKGLILTVAMTRPTGTQTRTFTYDANGKVLTATNPETGTVTNTYDQQTGLLQSRVDAKQNRVEYSYDAYKRVTLIKRFEWVVPSWPPNSPGSLVERSEQRTVFQYDSNSEAGFDPVNLAGRLAFVETYAKRGGAAWNAPGGGNAWETMTFREMYSYTTAGQMAKKRLKMSGRYSPAHALATDFLESSYTFDSEGRMTGQTYPAAHGLLDSFETAGASYTYGFDAMGRPNTMTRARASALISNVTYNAASQPTAISTSNPQVNGESRAYNVLGQLTSLTTGSMRFEYDFSATANDGRITTQRTYSGSTQIESISYSYDSLNRLANANGGSWTAGYSYL